MYTNFQENQSDGRHQDSILWSEDRLKEKKSRQVTRRASGMPVIFCPLDKFAFCRMCRYLQCVVCTLLCTSYFSISEIFFLFFFLSYKR